MAVEVACKRLQDDDALDERTTLEVEEIVTLFKLCLDATYICFRVKYYQQTFDTAIMSSPVFVVVANLVMEKIEERALSTFHSKPRFWKWYVDHHSIKT